MSRAFFDIEIIGKNQPRVMFGVKTGKQKHAFWLHKRGDLKRFLALLPQHTWVGFNSENFDRLIVAAAAMGYDAFGLKALAEHIIRDEMRSWQTYREFGIDYLDYDHIDLINVAPGVMISLKTYAGRMSYPTMIDMPFHHDHDLKPSELATVETYCFNDLNVTEALFNQLQTEMDLREELSAEYGIDLRSKSDAQIAEAILKAKCQLTNKDKHIPQHVRYTTPTFIKTNSSMINELVDILNEHKFTINRANGAPDVPDFLAEPVKIKQGTYQMGVGGLHSTHDNQMYLESSDKLCLSDFDVASYYPNIMLKAGLIPYLNGKGHLFVKEYERIYEQRMAAKRAGNKKIANSLKITLNGTFGKLGNIYCSFYSPDLLLAVTLTGQLNLLCLIHELEKIKDVSVRSANTDGVLVAYPPAARDKVLKVFASNSRRTGFEYEETPYLKYAAKDVNNYIAIKTDGKAKRKGLYAVAGVQEMKNPTMEVCSNAVAQFLSDGTPVERFIAQAKDIRDFVAVRNVKGGGVQHLKTEFRDDWKHDGEGWFFEGMTVKKLARKSRPPPREVGVGGTPFGRVARWYMTTGSLPPITYTGSGNKVPKTEGSRLYLNFDKGLPKDLDRQWYINEAKNILQSVGFSLQSVRL